MKTHQLLQSQCKKIQKIQQTGYGGYGGVHITKNNNQAHNYFWNTTNTNDAQKAELQGIHTALLLAHQIESQDITILCDCKNAVKYSNKNFITPHKYAQECQQIYTELYKLWGKNKHITINWIPGHTGETWNETADKLAKQAAKTWAHPHLKTSITAGILPSRQALNGQPIRDFAYGGDTGQL